MSQTSGTEMNMRLYIAMVVACYFAVSISMVFINKVLLSLSEFRAPIPIFIMWFQSIIAVLVVWGLGELKFQGQSKQTFDLALCIKVLPLSAIFLGMILFNQLCLQYVEVSFYNVARSLTIVFNVLLSYFLLNISTSFKAMGTIFIVIVGFYMGIEGEVNVQWTGVFFGVLSSLFVALYSVYTSSALTLLNGDKSKLIFYNNLNSVLLMIPLFLYFEGEALSLDMANASFDFWVMMIVAGLLGYLIGIVTMWQIQVTTPLTHNISGTAKASAQTVLALFIWKNPITYRGILGLALILGGSFAYSVVKMQESAASKSRPAAPAPQEKPIVYSEILSSETTDDEIFDSLPHTSSRSLEKII